MGLLTGKVALITGAARGIGKAIALKFADEGADIAFTDLVIDEEHGGLETEREIAAKGVKAKGYSGNAADFAETEALVNQINKDFGHIDILVNNAGITKDGLMLKMTEQQWDAVINVNLKSAFNFIHAITPIMMHERGGSIINMSSVVGVHGNAGQCNYAASKAGLIALAKSIGQEIGRRGIRANAIAPGFIDTAMTQALPEGYPQGMDPEYSSAPCWNGRRYRQCGYIPCFRHVELCLRSGDSGRRWYEHVSNDTTLRG